VDRNDAIAGLFEFAFKLGNLTAMLPQAENPDRPFLPLAKRLTDEANTLGRDPSSQIIAEQLLATAAYCERVTIAAYNPDEAMTVQIARWLESVFGSAKLKTTATITSVITGHEVTDRHVRNWLRTSSSHSAKNTLFCRKRQTPCRTWLAYLRRKAFQREDVRWQAIQPIMMRNGSTFLLPVRS
jgi:hypothetical protein